LGLTDATLYRYIPAARTMNTPGVLQLTLYPKDRGAPEGFQPWRRAAAVRREWTLESSALIIGLARGAKNVGRAHIHVPDVTAITPSS
jgi:hypothetical protein